jgi:predicted amidohydrolase YtcJ
VVETGAEHAGAEHAGAEQIVTARRIASMDPDAAGDPQAFATRGEWIVASGDLDELRAQFPDAQVRDFGSAAVVPGFNDAHQHPTVCAEQSLQVDLSPARIASTADLVAALRERAEVTPAGQWIVGCGYDHFRSNGGRELTREPLDEAFPDHPVLVVNVTLHAGVLNARALELAGIDENSEPPSGGEHGHDAAGRPNGIVHDQALYDLAFPAFTRRETVVPQPGLDELTDAFCAYARGLHAAGITSVGDALVGPQSWELLRRVEQQGRLDLRVTALVAHEYFDRFRPAGPEPGPLDRLRLGGVKAFADGAVNGGTCLVEQPIEGTDSHGLARVSAERMDEIVREVHDAGWRVCVHANGDRAIRRVVDSVEKARAANPRPGVRHRVEHCSIIDDDLLVRMRNQGMISVPFANYVATHGDKLRSYYGPKRIERMFAHRALLDAGVAVAGSSDFPCGPYEPLHAFRSCVTRRAPDGELFGPSQRITATEALALYTTGSAYASGEEATKGQLVPGHLADFAVLAEDPRTADPERLSEIPVLATWVGAEEVFRA